jgi:hypothetical protein
MSSEAKKPKQIQIEAPKDLKPTYSNFAIIHHNYNEIVIDFAHLMPNLPQAQVQSRIVMTPYHAKLLLQALTHNLQNYEKRFGEIKMRGSGLPDRPPMGFDPTQVH